MAQELLDDVLGHASVDEPGADGVAELMGMDAHWPAGLVAHVDAGLPVAELVGQRAVGVGLGAVGALCVNLS